MIQELKSKAIAHWTEFLPQKWADLVAEDRVDAELDRAARAAEKEIRQLMDNGARLDEAEEIVLPTLILLPPEELQEDEESREMEEEYQRTVGRPMSQYLREADEEYQKERAAYLQQPEK